MIGKRRFQRIYQQSFIWLRCVWREYKHFYFMQTYAAMKEVYGKQMLACSTIFHWHQEFTQGRASASLKSKSGRPVAASTETTVNTISTMLADDDSLLQRQIALVGILQTMVKKIILSLFFTTISVGVYAYTFTRNIRTGVLFALSG